MKSSISSIRIKFQRTFSATLIFCLLLVLTIVSAWSYYSYRRQAEQYLEASAKSAFADIKNKAERLTQMSVSLLSDPTVQSNLKAINAVETPESPRRKSETQAYRSNISAQIKNNIFANTDILLTRIYSLKGDEIRIGSVNREYLSYPMSIDSIYQKNGREIWGAAVSGETRCICLARAILDLNSMQPIGYMVITCDASYFSNDLPTMTERYTTHSFVIDQDGVFLASTMPEEVGGKSKFTEQQLKNGRVRDPGTGAWSFERIIKDQTYGWSVVLTFSAVQFWQQLGYLLIGILLLMAVILMTAAAITSRMIRRLVSPTERLVKGIHDFGHGNLNARVQAEGNDEITVITNAYNKMAERIQNLMDRVYKMEISNKEAEIEFLKMQINPHFLYNSLDTISWMGFACGSDDISDMAVSLANLLRASIKQKPIILVKEEITIVQSYLNVQHYRFTERFSARIDVPDDVKEFYMPGFLLQPLIENSIIHGLEGEISRKGLIEVVIRREEEWLRFTVSDNGCGMSREQLQTLNEQCRDTKAWNAIGVRNVYRRLFLIYGEQAQFHILSSKGQGTRISFRIRVMKDPPLMDNGLPTEEEKQFIK